VFACPFAVGSEVEMSPTTENGTPAAASESSTFGRSATSRPFIPVNVAIPSTPVRAPVHTSRLGSRGWTNMVVETTWPPCFTTTSAASGSLKPVR
jgi:hypothetical protein